MQVFSFRGYLTKSYLNAIFISRCRFGATKNQRPFQMSTLSVLWLNFFSFQSYKIHHIRIKASADMRTILLSLFNVRFFLITGLRADNCDIYYLSSDNFTCYTGVQNTQKIMFQAKGAGLTEVRVLFQSTNYKDEWRVTPSMLCLLIKKLFCLHFSLLT
jgi:hypothetical protein